MPQLHWAVDQRHNQAGCARSQRHHAGEADERQGRMQSSRRRRDHQLAFRGFYGLASRIMLKGVSVALRT